MAARNSVKRMVDSGPRKRMPFKIGAERLPRERPPLASPVEPFVDNASRVIDKTLERPDVERHTVVAEMSAYLGDNSSQNCSRGKRLRTALAHALSATSFDRSRLPLVFTFTSGVPRRKRPQ